ncbi:uncharacterized protein [Haliotis cracherodii]|uniref:uncharacterized protein isoform X1 n=1 Tax=Haliotis cracherodii TaxID=6455 RepID=UPI0039E7A707
MKLLVVFSVFVASALGQNGLPLTPVCSPTTCMVVLCMSAQGCDGRIEPHGGFCGCCPICVKQLSAGDSCDASASDVECGKGLHCDTSSHTCVKNTRSTAGPCALRHQEFLAQDQIRPGDIDLQCETDGTFKPKQCMITRWCFCVDQDGNDLGYYTKSVADAGNMDCTCARDKAAYLKTGLIGKLFFCDSKGSYNKKQCTGSVCFCADNNGKMLTNGQTVNIGEMDKLQC